MDGVGRRVAELRKERRWAKPSRGEPSHPREGSLLKLADALARDVHRQRDVLERGATMVRDVERARLLRRNLVGLEVREVVLDRLRARDIEEEVVLATHPRAGTSAVRAVSSGSRAR